MRPSACVRSVIEGCRAAKEGPADDDGAPAAESEEEGWCECDMRSMNCARVHSSAHVPGGGAAQGPRHPAPDKTTSISRVLAHKQSFPHTRSSRPPLLDQSFHQPRPASHRRQGRERLAQNPRRKPPAPAWPIYASFALTSVIHGSSAHTPQWTCIRCARAFTIGGFSSNAIPRRRT